MSQPCGTWIEGSGHSLDVLSIHQVVYNVWNHLMVLKRLGCWSIINAQAGLIRAVDWPSLHGLLCGTHLMPSLGYGALCTCNVSTWSCMKKEFLLILTSQLLGCKLQPTRVYCLKRWIQVLGYECPLSSKKILLVSIFSPFYDSHCVPFSCYHFLVVLLQEITIWSDKYQFRRLNVFLKREGNSSSCFFFLVLLLHFFFSHCLYPFLIVAARLGHDHVLIFVLCSSESLRGSHVHMVITWTS